MKTNCSSCNANIPENGAAIFCPFCLTQFRCKACSEMLVKDAIGCFACGTTIERRKDNDQARNQIEFEQKGDSKRFKAVFTDQVGSDLVSTFGAMVGVQIKKKSNLLGRNPISDLVSSNSSTFTDAEIIDEDDIAEALNRFIKVDGENIVFQTNNFKTTGSIQKAIRITLLTLFAYKILHNCEEIKRQKLTDILNKFKLNSGGFRTWIGSCDEVAQKSGSMIFLTPNGQDKAIQILKELMNPDVVESSVAFEARKKAKKKGGSNSEERKSSSPKVHLIELLNNGFFSSRRSLSDIVIHIKDNKAITLQTTDISGHMGKLLGTNGLAREKGDSGNYEYYVK